MNSDHPMRDGRPDATDIHDPALRAALGPVAAEIRSLAELGAAIATFNGMNRKARRKLQAQERAAPKPRPRKKKKRTR